MRILVLGDFGGRGAQGRAGAPADDRPEPGSAIHTVDIDNFDAVLARLAPRVALPAGFPSGKTEPIALRKIDDFHPDALFERLEIFQALSLKRRRLLDPATREETLADLERLAGGALPPDRSGFASAVPPAHPETGGAGTGTTAGAGGPSAAGGGAGGSGATAEGRVPPQGASAPIDRPREEDDATLARLLGRPHIAPQSSTRVGGGPSVDISSFLERLVAGSVVPSATPLQQLWVDRLDATIASAMRTVLHDPGLRALEALWRALHWLVTSLPGEETLEIGLLDLSWIDLEEDLSKASDDLTDSGLHRRLEERALRVGGPPASVIVAAYGFGLDPAALRGLGALGAIGARFGSPVLASAGPSLAGGVSFAGTPDPSSWTLEGRDAAAWTALRRSPVAPWIGLALPRFLLRLPYGVRGEPTERLVLEEVGRDADHESYLWGNPAFACARLLAEAYLESGWSMEPGDRLEIEDLPAFVPEGGERRLLPCAEGLLGERGASALIGLGLIPLVSHATQGAVRVIRVQSIADPPAPLAGPWS